MRKFVLPASLAALFMVGLNGCDPGGGDGGDNAIGELCENRDDCASGICVQLGNADGVCSEECGSNDDCPNNFECRQGYCFVDETGTGGIGGEPDVPDEGTGGIAGEPGDDMGTGGVEPDPDMGMGGGAGEPGDTGRQECQDMLACFNMCPDGDQNCTQNCFNNATPTAQSRYNGIIMCLQGNGCFDFSGNLDLECYFTECRDEALGCFSGIPGGGDGTCGEMLACLNNCPQGSQECSDECVDGTTVEGFILYDNAVTCVNENNCMDVECQNEFCGDELEACSTDGRTFGDGFCGGLIDCALGCIEAMGDVAGCVDACREDATIEANTLFDTWVGCANDAMCMDFNDCPACADDEATCRADMGPPECTGAGEDPGMDGMCCEGLMAIGCAAPGEDGMCNEECMGRICANNADGECGPGENVCNSPDDCGMMMGECAPEGAEVPVVPDAPECCEGLVAVSCDRPDEMGMCMEGCAGATICTNCGDGECGPGENPCNCAEDCAMGGPECVPAGESLPVRPGAGECCEGLVAIGCDAPDMMGMCQGCEGASICANNADGECGPGENICNSPEDCRMMGGGMEGGGMEGGGMEGGGMDPGAGGR